MNVRFTPKSASRELLAPRCFVNVAPDLPLKFIPMMLDGCIGQTQNNKVHSKCFIALYESVCTILFQSAMLKTPRSSISVVSNCVG